MNEDDEAKETPARKPFAAFIQVHSEETTTALEEIRGAGSEAEIVADLAQSAAEPAVLDPYTRYSVVVPDNGRLELVEPRDERLDHPLRATGTVKLATVGSFAEYVERHKDPLGGVTTVWVHPSSGEVKAVINDHQGTSAADGNGDPDANPAPGWGDHRAELALLHTPEWKLWTDADGDMLPQEAFAEHIEQGLPEVVRPDGADLLEIAQTLHATTNASFRSAIRLSDGTVQTQYDEEREASAGRKGEMTIPTEFELAIAPFLGEEREAVTARLRYRLNGGRLSLGYQLVRPHEVIRRTLDRVADQLSDRFARVYIGEPRQP